MVLVFVSAFWLDVKSRVTVCIDCVVDYYHNNSYYYDNYDKNYYDY